jgi:predicted methyltransferase
LFMQSYHDLYWRPKDGSWPATDAAKALAQLVPALKSGAVVVVVDHVANAGGEPTETVTAMHRIDPAILKRDFEAAGLKFDSESPAFANPADDHKKEVFDKSIRHKTDQVMYKFRK